jgi:hypothetical protein
MSAGKRPPLPVILSANALVGGEVVYWAGPGWSAHLGNALVARDEAGALALEAVRDAPATAADAVGAELVAVALDRGGRVIPSHYRERIRALGPTIRPDLGPQGRGEHSHVSL